MEHNRIRAGARRLLALSCAAAAVLLFGSGAAGQTQTPRFPTANPSPPERRRCCGIRPARWSCGLIC